MSKLSLMVGAEDSRAWSTHNGRATRGKTNSCACTKYFIGGSNQVLGVIKMVESSETQASCQGLVLRGVAVGLMCAMLYGGLILLSSGLSSDRALTFYLGPKWTVASILMPTMVALGAMVGYAISVIRRTAKRESELGIASCFVGAVVMLLQLEVVAAVALGVTDNQGILYALAIPFFVNCIGAPIGLVLAVLGFLQRGRNRKFAVVGLCLTLIGPVAFILFLALETSLLR